MGKLLFVGIAVLDYVFSVDALPMEAMKHRARNLQVVAGGLAANAAVTAARLGAEAALASRLGDDLPAAEIMAALEAEGVDCSLVRRFPGRRSPVSAVFVDRTGERMIMNHADPQIPDDAGWLPAALPAGTEAVLGDIRWEAGAHHLFALARAARIPAVLDVDRAPYDASLIDAASHVALSTQALEEMVGGSDVPAGLEKLARARSNWVAVTAGSDGVWFIDDGAIVHEPAFPVDAVDTLAAGDVWHGALTVALAEGRAPGAAVRFASAAAAIKCTRSGGCAGAPDRREVEEFLQARTAA
jgi:sulfofructose kinase